MIRKIKLIHNDITSFFLREFVNISKDFIYMRKGLEKDFLYIIDYILFIQRQVYKKIPLNNIIKYIYEFIILFHLGLIYNFILNPSYLIADTLYLITLDPIDPLNSDYYDLPLSRITILVILLLYIKYGGK